MGGGGGRRHWIGINFCHPEVKLQQQCQMQNIIFDLRSYHNWFYSFFLGEGECQYILETETGELEGKMKMTIQWESGICSSIITLIFGVFMTLGQHSGIRHVTIWWNWNNPAKRLFLCCYLPVKFRELSGKW